MPFYRLSAWLLASGLALDAGCSQHTTPPPASAPGASAPAATTAPVSTQTSDSLGTTNTPPNGVGWPASERAELVTLTLPPTEALEPLVKAELERAKADGRTVLIYVGATWCEPCVRFHRAVEAGLLNSQLRGVRFLELDLDRHARPIRAAGCESDLIPLFAAPTADGKCGPLRTMGGVKGDGALGNIMPRLLALIAQTRTSPKP